MEKPGAGSWLAYDPPFGELVIFGLNPEGGPPTKLVALNEQGLGRIALHAPVHFKTQSFARLTPTTTGGRLELGNRAGKTICDLKAASAGATAFFKSNDPQQGDVTLGVNGAGNGEIVVKDANGTISAKLP